MRIVERWLPVVGYETAYEVSDQGRVRSIYRSGSSGRVLTPALSDGYPRVHLSTAEKHGCYFVHHLVLTTFVGPRPEGLEAAHRNGVRTDACLGNLYWATKEQNIADLIRHGNHRRAMEARRPLTSEQRKAIQEQRGITPQADLATMFGVCRSTVQRIHAETRGIYRAKGGDRANDGH